jgi:hypothetical protein
LERLERPQLFEAGHESALVLPETGRSHIPALRYLRRNVFAIKLFYSSRHLPATPVYSSMTGLSKAGILWKNPQENLSGAGLPE